MTKAQLEHRLAQVYRALRNECDAHEATRNTLLNSRAEFEDVRRRMSEDNQRLRNRNPPPPGPDAQARIDASDEARELDVPKLTNGGQPAADAYSFIQLADFIAVIDARKQELYSDKRVRLGAPICRDGDVVTSITLANDWFDVVTASRTYRIPVTNVRSAVR